MNRAEFKLAFREARKVIAFERAFDERLSYGLISIGSAVPSNAYRAACRYGDALKFPPMRIDGKFRSRVR